MRSVHALPEYFSSSSIHLKVGMLCTLNRSDMCRQDSARSAQRTCSTWIFLFFKHSFKGWHAARTEPVRHAQTRFSQKCTVYRLYLNISLLQASIQRSASCAHRAGQACADKIQLEVCSIHALPEYLFLFFKHSFKGRHAAYTDPVRHAQTRFS